MSTTILIETAVSFIPAMGIDLLAYDASDLGLAMSIEVAACGGASASIDVPTCGTNDGLGLVAQTGAAGDDAELLIGCAGIDTSVIVALPATGRNVLLAWVDQSGANELGRSGAIPSTAMPYEMSVALMLHRIDIVAACVAVPVAVQVGGAR